MKYLFYCCKYLYCEINESEMSKKKNKKTKKKKTATMFFLKKPLSSLILNLCQIVYNYCKQRHQNRTEFQ